jgi:uncharacterized membrane protein YcaP (DUF421 family)
MELLTVIFRTTFFYVFILIIYRIMGKREIGQLSIQDLVVSILIAEMVAISIENTKDSLWLTIMPVIMLVFLEIIAAFASLKFNRFRNLIEGKPVLIINKGVVNFKEMVRQRYTLDDLLLELRSNNIKNLQDVEYAVLENNGKLNVFKYNFLKIKSENPFPLILDGIVQRSTLKYINKTELWLKDLVKKENCEVSDIFYAFYKNNKAYIIKKDDVRI